MDFWSMIGYNSDGVSFMEVFGNPSNIFLTDNPSFSLSDFSEIFPIFVIADGQSQEDDAIPLAVFNLFLDMANKSLKEARYKSHWEYMMCLYIAHYLTLYLQTQNGEPGAESALASALPRGVASSKSVDGLSISYDFMDVANDFSGYGSYKLTAYGQQLITLTSMYGKGGMWVNG